MKIRIHKLRNLVIPNQLEWVLDIYDCVPGCDPTWCGGRMFSSFEMAIASIPDLTNA